MVKKLGFLVFSLALMLQTFAQVNVRDSVVAGTLIHFNLGYNWPGAALADRYGSMFGVGLEVDRKTRSNWIFGVSSTFYFGDRVNNRQEIFGALATEFQAFIGLNGEYATIDFLHRGLYVGGHVGRIFPLIGPNQNSGLIVKVGAGYTQNQIHIRNPNQTFPQLNGEYRKGYDRLHTGLGLRQFVGYINSGNRRTINYTIGIEVIEGFTRNARGYNFDTRLPDTQRKLDMYIGFKGSWFLPLYRDQKEQFYYN